MKLDSVTNLFFEFSETEPVILQPSFFENKDTCWFDMHFAFELGILAKGCMVREYEGFEMEVNAGQVWMTGIWEPHGFHLLETPCETLVFIVSPAFLAGRNCPGFNCTEIFSRPPWNRPRLSQESAKEILCIVERLRRIQALDNPIKQQWLQVLFFETLLHLYESAPPRKTAAGTEVYPYQRLEPVIQHVFNSSQYIPVEQAADICGMSPAVFSSLFMKTMGLSFAKFAPRFRLRSAAHMLLTTDAPIKAIASDWGFTDSSHFIRLFSENYKMSPNDYRVRMK